MRRIVPISIFLIIIFTGIVNAETQWNRIWPSDAPYSTCTTSAGNVYPSTGENSATWFYYGCGNWKVFDVTPSSTVNISSRGDSCPGCILYHINYDIYEYENGQWVYKLHVDGPDVKGATHEYLFVPSSNKIKLVATNGGFYVKVYQTLVKLVPETGLVAEYNFDGDALDSSGNAIHGTNHGGTFVSGINGQALSLDGVNDYVQVPHSPELDLQDMTIELWMKMDSIYTGGDWAQDFMLVRKGYTPYNYQFHVNALGNLSFVSRRASDGSYVGVGGSYMGECIGNWCHVVGSYNGSAFKLYVNGNLDAIYYSTGTFATRNDPLRIGWWDGQRYFDGLIDEVKIYNRALSDAEVLAEYEKYATPLPENCTNSIDDDGDGLANFDDPDCVDKAALAEAYKPILLLDVDEEFWPVPISDFINNSQLYLFDSGTRSTSNLLFPLNEPEYEVKEWLIRKYYYDLGVEGKSDASTYLQYQGYQTKTYTRVLKDIDPNDGREKIVIQYWFFYLFNPGIFNKHEGDWEMIQLWLDYEDYLTSGPNTEPEKIAFSVHGGGLIKSWSTIERDGLHPKVYVAKGSHASYPSDGIWDGCLYGDRVKNAVNPISYNNLKVELLTVQPWLEFKGGWGYLETYYTLFGGKWSETDSESGPTGPKKWKDGSLGQKWENPLQWADSACSSRKKKGYAVSKHSPINLTVIGSTGAIGYMNGEFVNTLPGALILGVGEDESYFVPLGDDYAFVATGTGVGTFDLIIEKITDSGEEKVVYENVPVTDSTQAFVRVENGILGGNLEVDQDGDGTVDEIWALSGKISPCSDGLDNDSDGLIDMDDPGCSDPPDDDETDETTPPTTTITLPPGGQEIPEFPTVALPVIIAAGGYLAIRRLKKRE